MTQPTDVPPVSLDEAAKQPQFTGQRMELPLPDDVSHVWDPVQGDIHFPQGWNFDQDLPK